MRTRKLGLTLLGGLALVVAACSSGTSSPSAAAPESQAPASEAPASAAPGSGLRHLQAAASMQPIKVGVVTDVGQLEDKSFNQSSGRGRQGRRRRERRPHDVIVTQNISDDAANIQTFVDQDFDVIVTVGFLLGTDTRGRQGQPRHPFRRRRPGHLRRRGGRPRPDVRLQGRRGRRSCRTTRASSSPRRSPATSPASLPPASPRSDKIGAIGGTNVPAVVNYWRGYENGVEVDQAGRRGPLPGNRPGSRQGLRRPDQGPRHRRAVHRPGRRRDLPARRPDRPGRPRGRL